MSRERWAIPSYTISDHLCQLRDKFCPHKGTLSCTGCPIYKQFYHLGYSCNGALAAYPEECQIIMRREASR